MNLAGVLLEIDPSIVKPGWTALLVTLFIGAALVLLYFSLRRQFRRIDPALPYADDLHADESAPAPPDITGKNG